MLLYGVGACVCVSVGVGVCVGVRVCVGVCVYYLCTYVCMFRWHLIIDSYLDLTKIRFKLRRDIKDEQKEPGLW